MLRVNIWASGCICGWVVLAAGVVGGADRLRELQTAAIEAGESPAAHWGTRPGVYSDWSNHTNRLIPVYAFGTRGKAPGIDLESYTGKNSAYRNADLVRRIYGRLPTNTVNPGADYMDQTDLAALQRAALAGGKKHVILVVFDGMDWQTTRAAAIYNQGRVSYTAGRGAGTHFQNYTAGETTQFGFMVTSPHNEGTLTDVDDQRVLNPGGKLFGGYNAVKGGATPWTPGDDANYLIARSNSRFNPLAVGEHAFPDSASTATAMTTGVKTFNNAIDVDQGGGQLTTVAHDAQARGFLAGVVTSVPFSHATPACAYAHNVDRDDYQDLSRDLLGLPSISHPKLPLPGLEVVIGGGYGVDVRQDKAQGANFEPGNQFLAAADLQQIDASHGGKYVVAQRTAGVKGKDRLLAVARESARQNKRLFGFYGVGVIKGHLPFQTADGGYDPAPGKSKRAEVYSRADLEENPTLADMTAAALIRLGAASRGFWLMVEAGDVDWANHDNNLDNSIGAVNSGDAAVKVITDWVEKNSNWQETVLIVTADHGHFLVIDRPELIAGQPAAAGE